MNPALGVSCLFGRTCSRRGAFAVLLTTTAVTFSGCAVGPDFHRPAVPAQAGYTAAPLPARIAGAATTGGDAQALAVGQDVAGEWWTLFRSPRLNALIALALKNNPDLAAAQATLLQARDIVRADQGALLPAVSAAFGASRQQVSAFGFGGSATGGTGGTGGAGESFVGSTATLYNLFNASVSVSYAVDVWGGTRRTVEQAAAQAEDQRFVLEATYLALTANIVSAAVAEGSLQAQIAATEEVIADEQSGLRLVQAQLAAGAVTRAVVLQQQSQLLASQATLPPLQSELAQERVLLATYLGLYPSQFTDPPFDLSTMALPQTLPVSLPSALVAQRPDILQAESNLHAQTAAIGIATANMLPDVTLSGSYGSDAVKIGSLFGSGTIVYSLGAQIAQKLFEGGTLLYQRRAAVAGAQAAAAQYKSTVIKAFANVSDALLALQYDASGLQVALDSATSAHQSLELLQVQYKAGAITNLDVLTAQQTERNALITLVRAQAARYSDTVALFQALGGGWWNRQDLDPKVQACCRLLP